MGEKRVQSLEQGSEIKRRPISGLAADFFGSRASRLNPNRRGQGVAEEKEKDFRSVGVLGLIHVLGLVERGGSNIVLELE